MNRPTMLHLCLIREILEQASLPADRDVETFRRRAEHEGDGFAAITLPTLGQALEFGLEHGYFPASDCTSFRMNKSGTLPLFLTGLWENVFTKLGVLRHDADTDSIYGIRQICYWSKKPKEQCSDSRTRKAIEKFKHVEEELRTFDDFCRSSDPVLRSVSDLLWVGMFSHLTPESITCRHGPGQTAERKSPAERWTITSWSERAEDTFPLVQHGIPNYGFYRDLEGISLLPMEAEPPVRVVTVPKTQKAPRIIAIEPSHVQYMQQGLMRFVTPILESNELTQHSVHFTDQSVNRLAAERASADMKRATLDLSDASDRVHNELVLNIFRNSRLLPYMQACRSARASLPSGKTTEVINLRKFASMGSAMCFPTEAMVFYTLTQVAYHYYYGITPSRSSIKRFSRSIDIYGDDIICQSNIAGVVRTCLEAFGLKVNQNKSFVKGNFRESCGGDYYKKVDVTPIYLRNRIPSVGTHLRDLTVVESLVATSNQLYQKGLWRTCQLLRDWIDQLSRFSHPRARHEGEGIFYLSAIFTTKCSWSKSLCAHTQRRICTSPIKVADATSGVGSFLRAFLTGGQNQIDFDRSVRRGASKAKRRWVQATLGLALV